jgi:hypothetical protein
MDQDQVVTLFSSDDVCIKCTADVDSQLQKLRLRGVFITASRHSLREILKTKKLGQKFEHELPCSNREKLTYCCYVSGETEAFIYDLRIYTAKSARDGARAWQKAIEWIRIIFALL